MFSVMLNHALSMVLSPVGMWFISMAAVAVAVRRGWRRTAWGLGIGATVVLWIFSCGWSYRILGGALEGLYPPVRVEQMPQADAIFVLGGGIGAQPEKLPYPEMYAGADRVWHAARLWKAGKAPVVITSGSGDLHAAKPLLLDFGVSEKAILVENDSRNTEENARFAVRMLKKGEDGTRPRLLLVTSAWHMRRSRLMFERYAPELEIIPAPCDHEALMTLAEPLSVKDFFPGAEPLFRNGYVVKEIVGYYGYKWFKR